MRGTRVRRVWTNHRPVLLLRRRRAQSSLNNTPPLDKIFLRTLRLSVLFGISFFGVISSIHAGDPSLKTELTSPEDGAVFNNYPRTATFKWKAVLDAAKYLIEVQCSVKDMDTGNSTWIEATKKYVTGTQFNMTSFPGAQTGRWRVTAYDAGGGEGESSEWRTFRFTR